MDLTRTTPALFFPALSLLLSIRESWISVGAPNLHLGAPEREKRQPRA